MKSLFLIEDQEIGLNFGVQPYDQRHLGKYMGFTKPVDVREDLGWREKEHLQNILVKTDFWDDFPLADARLVSWELKSGDEDQRIDMLYLTSTLELVPVELKLGGKSRDTHGQLLRYVADLHFSPWTMSRIRLEHGEYAREIQSEIVRLRAREAFASFTGKLACSDSTVVPVRRGGVIIDTAIPSQVRTAVRYLNQQCGFSISMLEMQCFTDDGWTPGAAELWMRIDFVAIT